MRQNGSFWNWYKIMGIIKASCVDLDDFYDRVKFVPDVSVWVTAYRVLIDLVFPSLF